jgi:hypothetical protein
MTSAMLLKRALILLENNLSTKILSITFRPSLKQITFELQDGIIGHLKYNDFKEYGYNITFSPLALDRCRFDNFDALWNVKTAPHHFHPRHDHDGHESPMIGDPDNDIPILCKRLEDGSLKDKNLRF